MNDRVPVERSTKQLIEDGKARQEALADVERVLAEVTGTATDQYQTVRVTVDGRGKVLDLWLRQDAVRWGPNWAGSSSRWPTPPWTTPRRRATTGWPHGSGTT
ncbi:YbaB/EbfC family nucleoid-associated protein [Actinokineospora soli]|uniref:YbaB/EbfC family nucleoid-associated protein n=1 Tax=Actinokineospora soli TaxID=1048753 RepID=A0ABW2TWV3_9PSEU